MCHYHRHNHNSDADEKPKFLSNLLAMGHMSSLSLDIYLLGQKMVQCHHERGDLSNDTRRHLSSGDWTVVNLLAHQIPSTRRRPPTTKGSHRPRRGTFTWQDDIALMAVTTTWNHLPPGPPLFRSIISVLLLVRRDYKNFRNFYNLRTPNCGIRG